MSEVFTPEQRAEIDRVVDERVDEAVKAIVAAFASARGNRLAGFRLRGTLDVGASSPPSDAPSQQSPEGGR